MLTAMVDDSERRMTARVAKLVNAKVFSPKYKGTTGDVVSVVRIHPLAQNWGIQKILDGNLVETV